MAALDTAFLVVSERGDAQASGLDDALKLRKAEQTWKAQSGSSPSRGTLRRIAVLRW